MKLNIIRKKASSLRELSREQAQIPDVSTLEELLGELVKEEFRKRKDAVQADPVLSENEMKDQERIGRIRFSASYEENMGDIETAIQVMRQDFEDGLFRVYLNGKECLELKEKLKIKDGDEVVLLRFVMLAGRMW